MSGYKFTTNLIRLSVSKIETEAIKEWDMVESIRHDKDTEETRCICSRPLELSFICRNKINLKVIKMGSKCVKKILGQTTKNVGEKTKNNNINFFTKGQYIDIHDLSQYVVDVLKEYIQKIYSLQEIEILLEQYKDHPQLQTIIRLIYQDRLQKHQQEKEERLRKEKEDEEIMKHFVEKQKEERLRKEKEEILRKEKEDEEIMKRFIEKQKQILEEEIRQKEYEKERKIDEENQIKKKYQEELILAELIKKRKDYDSEIRRNLPFEGCCTLRMNEHCICKEPRFKASHIDPYLHCSMCYKWKCRA